MRYRFHSTNVKSERWYPTKAEAIAAFERSCKRLGIRPPDRYPPGASGDSITTNDIASRAMLVLQECATRTAGCTLTPATIDWGAAAHLFSGPRD